MGSDQSTSGTCYSNCHYDGYYAHYECILAYYDDCGAHAYGYFYDPVYEETYV